MAIDGDIYVLNRDGEVLQYRRGELLPLELRDKPSEQLQQATRIFTLPEHNNFYILDKGLNRVVVYSKGQSSIATYQKQVVFPSLPANSLQDLYVDIEEQKLIVLTTDKVYITDL